MTQNTFKKIVILITICYLTFAGFVLLNQTTIKHKIKYYNESYVNYTIMKNYIDSHKTIDSNDVKCLKYWKNEKDSIVSLIIN